MSKNINSFYYCYHDFGSRRGTKGYELKKKKKKKKKEYKKQFKQKNKRTCVSQNLHFSPPKCAILRDKGIISIIVMKNGWVNCIPLSLSRLLGCRVVLEFMKKMHLSL